MSVEPPSSGRPTGPPSGPLSGPSQPPSGPPSQPPGGSGGAPPSPEPHRPWWRSVPRIALLATAVAAAVVLGLVLTRPDGGSGKSGNSEVFLQAAGKTGPDPFTGSTATDSSAAPVSASPATESASPNAVRGVDGSAPGLYGGTRNVASCDVKRQIKALRANPPVNQAFASVAGVQPSGVPAYLRSLTPVQLRMDTRVTNHGYRDGHATGYQAVLQSGTAVLVDSRGVPRVRCACGNPLTPPVAQRSAPKRTGDTWSSYRPSNVVVVAPSVTVINIFVIYDHDSDDWVARHRGDTAHKDKPTEPPVNPVAPSASVITPTAPTTPTSPSTSPSSPEPCLTTATGTPSGTPTDTPSDSATATPCPPTSDSGATEEDEPSADTSVPQPPLAFDTPTESGSTYSAPGPR
ncbi:DUF6777 domain-containing protein [Streptomyces sp. WM6386]|uniref:DUF6777 domain-containing protein n=1 Tax=Streptomyces sp. WM6386 TaxID=1415558 RepID=UPI000619A7C4|nr:DUF6777 domain-containing protein [Streptomyces sp. WM6386]KKD06780.1 hypothetical protein TN53_16490 [Streptomyces sp. WM6386]